MLELRFELNAAGAAFEKLFAALCFVFGGVCFVIDELEWSTMFCSENGSVAMTGKSLYHIGRIADVEFPVAFAVEHVREKHMERL